MVRQLQPEKKLNFLQTALKLFVQKGVQQTSTAEIAKEAGTAAGTLFLYFPTKQNLIDELVLKISREHSDHIQSILQPSFSAHKTFYTIWNESVRWFLDNMDAYRFVQQVRDTNMISGEIVQETGKYYFFYYDVIKKGLGEGSIQPYPLDLIGGFLYQDIVAIVQYIQIQADVDRDEAIEAGFSIFWDGIKSKKNI